MNTGDNDFIETTQIGQSLNNQADLLMTPLPYADDEANQTILPIQNDDEYALYKQNTIPVPVANDDDDATPPSAAAVAEQSVVSSSTDVEAQAEDLQLDFGDDDDDSNMPFSYLENEHNLQFPQLSADTLDTQKPHSAFQAVGDWLKQATDVRTYWNALESFGEDVAQYKWAYDQGNMGDFDAAAFSKETLKAAARGFTSDNLRMMGNVLSAFGANIENKHLGTAALTAGTTLFAPQAGTLLKNIGDKFQYYADRVETNSVLSPMQTAYNTDPSWEKLANVLGQGSAQVLSMGAMAKYIGAAPTYALFAGGGAAQVFNESFDKEGNIDTANTLALLSGATTFAIDKIFNPLPKQIENRAKMTSKMIAKEILGAPLREAGTEVLQQLLAENLVRQVGIDDTQDLFEGLVESAIGAIAGTSALMAVDGTAYYAHKTFDDVRRRMLLKGVSDEDIELFKKNAMELLQTKPEAFSKVFSYSLEQNLNTLERDAMQASWKDKSMRKADLNALRKIYDEMYQRTFNATHDDTKAKITASMVQANIMAFYAADKSFSPQKILWDGLPEIKKITYENFKKQVAPEAKLQFQFGGVGAKFANIDRLREAYKMEENKINPRAIWAKTGWYRGGDGLWRFEISDAKAKLKLDFKVDEKDLPKRYWHDYIQQLEKMEALEIINLRSFENSMASDANVLEEIYNYMYSDFIDFLDENYSGRFSFKPDIANNLSFTDPEDAFERNIKAKQETIDNQILALVSGYEHRIEVEKNKKGGSIPVYIRDKTLKQLLIDRDKFDLLDDGDIEQFTSANENGLNNGDETPSSIQSSELDRDGNASSLDDNLYTQSLSDNLNGTPDPDTSNDVLVAVRASDYKNEKPEVFNQTMKDLLNSYQGMKIFNPSLNQEIEIKIPALKNTQNLSDENKLLIPYLPMLLEKALFVPQADKNDRKTKSAAKNTYFSYLPIEVDGKRNFLHINVHENAQGNLVWNLRWKNISAQEIDADISKASGELVALDDYIAVQKRNDDEVSNSSQGLLRKWKAANSNKFSPDRYYTAEQLKIIRAALEEKSFFNFMSDIWSSSIDEDSNIQRLDEFLKKNQAKTPMLDALSQKLDVELLNEAAKRQKAIQSMGLRENFEMFDDLTVNKMYQLYLAGQGDFHKPYFNPNYLSKLYRLAHIPLSMSERFLALPRYRSLRHIDKSFISEFLDRIYRIYRFHKEIEFAKKAELRDIQAANAFIKDRVDNGDRSLRSYWRERQLLLDNKEMMLGDLLDHEELYKNYPDLKNVIVRFTELNSNDGYHFYRDKKLENDVLEIDVRQFDYTNLKDLLMKGAAFAIQMREHFDLALSSSQRHNFMDRHLYLAKAQMMNKMAYLLEDFVATYLPDEDVAQFWIDKDVPLPILDIYKSQSIDTTSLQNASSQKIQNLKYKDINFDLLYQKVDERYAAHVLDPHERQLGDFAYSSLRDLLSRINLSVLTASRVTSGYFHTAPFPWGGELAQGNIDVRNMLQRQNYSDWQKSFAYWDDRIRKPQLDKTQLPYSLLRKFTATLDDTEEFVDFNPEKMNSIPDDDNKIKAAFDGTSLVFRKFAKGAYEIADKTIYLFEKADEKTIIHETFHYLSQLLKTSLYNTDSKLRYAYSQTLEELRKMVFDNYNLVHKKGKYSFVSLNIDDSLPDIVGKFSSQSEALDYAVEELFVQLLWNSLSNKLYPKDDFWDILNYFYCAWMVNISETLVSDKEKYSNAAENLMMNINRYLTKAFPRLIDKLK